MKYLISCFLFFAVTLGVIAQEQLIRKESLSQRQNRILSIPENPDKLMAVQLADSLGLPKRTVYPDGRITEIRRLSPFGMPMYLTTHNLNAAKTLSTNIVWKRGDSELNLTGKGVIVGVWDAGILRDSHREFEGRGRVMDPFAIVDEHSTHVSGTIGAAGLDRDARGMANKVILEGYDWGNDLREMEAAAAEGLLISNHSYGFILGYDFNVEEDRWEWFGYPGISEEEDYLFGYYHEETAAFDRIAYNNPYYLIVKAAGNDRGDNPPGGKPHYIFQSGDWVLSTVDRPKDGGLDGFDCMGPVSTAKNIMAVGAVHDLPNGYDGPESVRLTNYSVFGPTDDGRIKPDVVANGTYLYSTQSGHDSDYGIKSGTSTSAPNVAGSMALLQEHYHAMNGEYLKAASLKGLVLHASDDAGNPGPDYKFGWGLMNTQNAARIISNTDYQLIQEHSLENGNELRIPLFCDGTESIRATLCWTDPPGTVLPPALDRTDRILINDLDIRIIRDVDGKEFRPYILDPLQPDNPAITGDNILDNVEQVFIENAEKGIYEIVIRHKGELEMDNQDFSLVISGLFYEFFASGINYLSDNNGSFILTSAEEYLPDMQAGWLITPENGSPVSLYFNFFETEANQDILTIYDGKDASAPVLAELSGTGFNEDTLIISTTDTMWIAFTSDNLNQGKGFSAFYCTTSPEGSFEINGSTYPCEGSSEIYVVSGQEGTNYRWELPEGWNLQDSGTNFSIVEIGSGTGMLGVIPFNRCGEAPGTGISIEPLSSAPELNTFTGDTMLCAGDTGIISVNDLPGATYEWTLPDNWQGSSDSSEITFIPSLDQGQIRVSAFNSCGSGDTLVIPSLARTIPDKSEIFSSSDKICQNSAYSFYINPAESTTYEWSVEPGWNIVGDNHGDTVEVVVGENPGFIHLIATNECGFRNSTLFILLDPQPESPLLMESQSVYEDYRELEVQNASAYVLIQWYHNNEMINSPGAIGPSYVAYLPGLYTVGVENQFGCTLLQAQQDGLNISSPNNSYAVYGGAEGSLFVHNYTSGEATLKLYDMTGNLMMVHTIDPLGYKEIDTELKGIFMVSVSGQGNLQVFKLFLH